MFEKLPPVAKTVILLVHAAASQNKLPLGWALFGRRGLLCLQVL